MTRILAHYHIGGVAADIEARAAALALEQSIEMPLTAVASRYVRDEVVARVANIRALGPALHEVTLAIATATVGRDIGQLMNMLFGNCSLQDDVVLHDVELPATLLSHWRGPRHGLAGLRTLVGAGPRALTMTALKPQGLPATELAQLAATFADAGIDIIKDDHGIADQDYAPFAARGGGLPAGRGTRQRRPRRPQRLRPDPVRRPAPARRPGAYRARGRRAHGAGLSFADGPAGVR